MPRVVLIANTIIFVLALVPSFVPIMFSGMLFDDPSSAEKWYVWLLFFAFVSFPFVVVGSLIAGWVLYRFGKQELGMWLSCLPYFNVVVVAVMFLFWR